MTLPGRLSIAFLEEDNPAKFYFRLRPLLVREQERIELFQEEDGQFPTEGFIRVVPDKNEISQFKSRMRMMGRYCMLDLRRHAGENDKIRQNKNCIPNGNDVNAYIVYSDVIYSLAPGLLTQLIECDVAPDGDEFALPVPAPETGCVALRCEGKVTGPWKWETGEEGKTIFRRTPALSWSWQDDDQPSGLLLSLEIPGSENRSLYVNLSVLDRKPEAVALPQYTAPVLQPVLPIEPSAEKAEPAACIPPVPACGQYPSRPIGMEPTTPLTTHRAINSRITMREQQFLAQIGVSPRRGRSLYEIVDEKWRHSRFDQLGHPIPLQAMGTPADDPIEIAMSAIRAVLPLPEARTSLIAEMLRNETLNEALGEVFSAKHSVRADDACLTELEADRLSLSAEIDALKRRREAERSLILEEVRTEYAMEFARLDQKKEELQSDIASLAETEKTARDAADAAVETMNRALSEDVDSHLMDFSLKSRARSLILGMNGDIHTKPTKPVTGAPSACQLISDVRAYFERAARPIDNDAAVNLLACLTVGRTLLISGPVGSGKRDTIRMLAMAIGIAMPEYKRFTITSNTSTAEKLISDGSLVCDDEAMTLCVLASANMQDDVRKSIATIYGAQMRRSSGLRAVLTIDDAPDGYPIPAALFDRTYMIRLDHAGADQPWRPADVRPLSYGQVVSLSAMEKAFAPNNDLPVEMELRMTALREQMDKLGTPFTRRSLDALWRYCSAVIPYMQCSPLEVLDLAISQRGLPTLLSTMPLEALMELPEILKGMPRCLKLLDEPLPLPAIY